MKPKDDSLVSVFYFYEESDLLAAHEILSRHNYKVQHLWTLEKRKLYNNFPPYILVFEEANESVCAFELIKKNKIELDNTDTEIYGVILNSSRELKNRDYQTEEKELNLTGEVTVHSFESEEAMDIAAGAIIEQTSNSIELRHMRIPDGDFSWLIIAEPSMRELINTALESHGITQGEQGQLNYAELKDETTGIGVLKKVNRSKPWWKLWN